MEKHDHTFHYEKKFELEAGGSLSGFQLKYTTLGKLNRERSNVVWICHALTGSSDFTSWWCDLFTEDGPFSPQKYFIICANMLGGCYGSTGPLSIDPQTGKPYYHHFPTITNRDVVGAFDLLRQELHLDRIHTVIGGSLGGQQAMEWTIAQPLVFQNIILLACNAVHSPWGIAFNEAQRMAIQADPTWKENEPRAGIEGMKAARAIGMISYRQYETFQLTQSEKGNNKLDEFRAATYQRYQGDKLANRFNAFTYWIVSKLMDGHNVGRNRESIEHALASIKGNVLVIGIDSDLLFPASEQKFLAQHIPNAELEVIQSAYGHDGFLVEFNVMKDIIKHHFKKETLQEVLV